MSIERCCYGCGQAATVHNKRKNTWRCAASPSSCPINKEINRAAVKAKFLSLTEEQRLAQKNKRQLGMLAKYGVVNASQNEIFQSKKKATFIEKYGCDNPSKNEAIKSKIRDKWPSVAHKREQTNIHKYGVSSYSSTEEFKNRRKNTWLAKYGVDNPAKADLIKDKIQEGQKYRRTNKQVCLAGKVYSVQGYEPIVIKELLKAGIKESEIVLDKKLIPKISYTDQKGHSHRYYPDIWIPKFNMLIEVKSLWTWQKYKEINLLKIAAAKLAGYTIRVMVR